MDLRQGNGQSGSVGFLPFEVAPTPVRPGSGIRVLRMRCLNVMGCNGVEKRDEIGCMFEECQLDILGLSQTKMRGEGEMSFRGVRGVKSVVGRRENAREGVAVLMNEHIWMCVHEIRRINSRIMYAGVCIKREFWDVIIVYVPELAVKDLLNTSVFAGLSKDSVSVH